MLVHLAERNGPTIDEPGHLAAAIVYAECSDFSLYRVNPPLVRLVAGLPLLGFDLPIDDLKLSKHQGSRPEMDDGQMLMVEWPYFSFALFAARCAVIPVVLLGGWFCFALGRSALGDIAGLATLVLWVTSPTILTSGCLISSDACSATATVATVYALWSWLHRMSWTSTLMLGIALGAALVTKFTCLVLIPAIVVVATVATPRFRSWAVARRALGQVTVAMLIAVLVINATYGFEDTGRELGQFQFGSCRLSGLPMGELGNRWNGTTLGEMRVPIPANYLLGIDQQWMDFENSRPKYFLGHRFERGAWYFYFVAALLKFPLGFLALLALSSIVAFKTWRRTYLIQVSLLAPLAAIIILLSANPEVQYFRYLAPALPLLFIWASQCISIRHWRWRVIGWICVLSAALSSLFQYPLTDSYFHEIACAASPRFKLMDDSDLDWGQSFPLLVDWLAAHKEIHGAPVHFAVFVPGGTFDRAQQVGDIPCVMRRANLEHSTSGWHIISAHYLGRDYVRHRIYCDLRPYAEIGRTIFVFRIP
jgi:hypothetical protein